MNKAMCLSAVYTVSEYMSDTLELLKNSPFPIRPGLEGLKASIIVHSLFEKYLFKFFGGWAERGLVLLSIQEFNSDEN